MAEADLNLRRGSTARPCSFATRWPRRLRKCWPSVATSYLQGLRVLDVEPAPDASRLLVTLAVDGLLDEDRELDLDRVHDHLARASGHLRSEVATAITRKRAPVSGLPAGGGSERELLSRCQARHSSPVGNGTEVERGFQMRRRRATPTRSVSEGAKGILADASGWYEQPHRFQALESGKAPLCQLVPIGCHC